MAKFLDKKEQVIDFQLTPYGKHRLSVGQLKPAFYAFFDTGVTYDSEYAGFSEVQTKIHERIKTETQFIEGILLFEEAENTVPESEWVGETYDEAVIAPGLSRVITGAELEALVPILGSAMGYDSAEGIFTDPLVRSAGYKYVRDSTSLFDLDIVPKKFVPKPNVLSFESAIGDAAFEGKNTQHAPAWKLLACQGEITNVETKDVTKYNLTSAEFDNEIAEFNIPQIDVKANYTLEISKPAEFLSEESPSDFVSETLPFLDGSTIKLIKNDVMVYAEEINTQLLTENFDIEVFEMIEDTGLVEKARAELTVGATAISVGDTVTIGDGITTETFEFIAVPGGTPAAGNIGVYVSNNYYLDGTSANRKGTILNLLSALNQDDGSTTSGYPSDYDKSDAGNTARGRCRGSNPVGCYTGRHNLKIAIKKEQIGLVATHNFSAGGFPIKLINNNTTQGNPNQLITSTGAAARISPAGFLGGYTTKGVELKRKYFVDSIEQIVDGLMIASTEQEVKNPAMTEDSVEYYFNILTDSDVSGKIACSCASTFNRDSYYIDIDFDCAEEDLKRVYYDIYGSATSPEVCNPPIPGGSSDLGELLPETDICEDE